MKRSRPRLLRCPACGRYTLAAACPACGANTYNPAPPKFSPADRRGRARRALLYGLPG